MNILIINPPIRMNDKPRHIPHGLSIIANIIRKKFKCHINFIDVNAQRYSHEQLISIIKNSPCDIALIGALITTYKSIISIAQLLKLYHPDCLIVAGGSVAMSIPETLLENSLVDIICMGEGERTIVNLINAYQARSDLSQVNGIALLDSDRQTVFTDKETLIQNMDKESDMPAYDLLPMEIYLSNAAVGLGRDIDFISSRGCPFHCSFCYQPWGQKNRIHSSEFIKEAILHLKKNYKINFVSFQDDLFIANKKRFYEFCELRNKYFPDIYWSCTGRANICNEELVKAARESGCTLISYGFESGSPEMLNAMNKKVNLDQMENVIALNRKYGFPIPVSFILGMPGETQQSTQETLDFCIKNNLTLDSLMYATPYPGTELFNFALKTGRIDNIHEFVMRLDDARDFTINLTDEFTDTELQLKFEEMKSIAKKNYKPLSQKQIEKRIKSLYGPLSEYFFSLSGEDREHRAKHGAMGLF